jgi:hypothetical protein
MKKTLLTLLLVACSASASYAKPGGWIKDFLANSGSRADYCPQNQIYYGQRTVYYQPAPVVIYEYPRYYAQPQYVPMQPYQNHQYIISKPYYHCR